MRKSGIITLLVIAAIIVALSFIFTDKWLEGKMESLGSSVVGAKVEFDGVDFSFLNLRMHWNRLQVTDPNDTWTNLFETGQCDFDLELVPLFSRKVIVENLQMNGLRFSTKRETDGALPKKAEEKKAETPEFIRNVEKNLKNEANQVPLFNLAGAAKKADVDSIWRIIDLKSPGRIDSLKNVYQQKYADWGKRINNLPDENDLKQFQERIQSIHIDQIKTVDEFQNALSTVSTLYKRADSLSKAVKQVRSDFQSEVKQVQDYPQTVKTWVNQDYQRALRLAQLPDISVKNVARIVFGRQVIDRIQNVTGYVGTARYYANKYQAVSPKKEKPPRLKGQDIHFVNETELPKFWVKKIDLSGETPNEFKIEGAVTDIVSQQKLIGKPTVITVKGSRKDQATLGIQGTLDYLGEKPAETIEIKADQMPLQNVKLTSFPLIPYKIQQGKGQVNATIKFQGQDFLSDIRFRAAGLQFDYNEKPANLNARLADLAQSITRAIKLITLKVTAQEQNNQFSLHMDSNLDELIASRVKEIISGEIAKARQQIQDRIDKEVDKYRKQLEDLVQSKQKELQAQLAKAEQVVQEQKDELQKRKKEIEDRIEKEKKDKLKNALDNLFNK